MIKSIKRLNINRESIRHLTNDMHLVRGGTNVIHTNPPRPVAGGGVANLGNCDTLVAPCGPTHQCTAVCGTQTCNANCSVA